MDYKRILTIQDISCVGQCSITVALPVLSVCGFETAVLPLSVLSNHTTGFNRYTFRDLSSDISQIINQWQKNNISFSAVYTGYMGNKKQIEYTLSVFDSVLDKSALKIVDPAMADNGQLYPDLDKSFVTQMKRLCTKADIILPNITEACLLTETPYTENYTPAFIISLGEKLSAIGCKQVIFTGVSYDENTIGAVIYDNGKITEYSHSKLPHGIPGTGDLFASVFTGAFLKGNSLYQSVKIAADFTFECMKNTLADPLHTYGPKFEPLLPVLLHKLKLY